MKAILAGVLIGICLPLVAGYLFVICGGMPVATKEGPLPIEEFLVNLLESEKRYSAHGNAGL